MTRSYRDLYAQARKLFFCFLLLCAAFAMGVLPSFAEGNEKAEDTHTIVIRPATKDSTDDVQQDTSETEKTQGTSYVRSDLPVADIIDGITDPEALNDFSFPEEAKLLRVVFPRIKECDACLVTDGEHAILIDTATAKQAPDVVKMIKRQGVSHLDAVYITHPHPDHGGGLGEILAHFTVDKVWSSFSDQITQTAKDMKAYCEHYNVPLGHYGDGHVFTVGEAYFKTYATDDTIYTINDRSAAYRMQYGRAVMFFAADLERLSLRRLGNTVDADELRMDIIKYPHHGKDPLVREFWQPAQLRFAIVTSDATMRNGKQDIRDKHWPHAFTWDGEIELTTDGNTWVIRRLPDYAEEETTEKTIVITQP